MVSVPFSICVVVFVLVVLREETQKKLVKEKKRHTWRYFGEKKYDDDATDRVRSECLHGK